MEGTRPIVMNMEGTRPPTGASPTQPYKCGQNVKVKTNGRDNTNTNHRKNTGDPQGPPDFALITTHVQKRGFDCNGYRLSFSFFFFFAISRYS